MLFKRKWLKKLQAWKDKKERKPLIIRGARQVGKSTLVEQFARSYRQYIPLNLELYADRRVFEDHDHIDNIVQSLLLKHNISSGEDNLLIFIDEIQESPEAIGQLRYFYERYPQYHIIAAGSLLEFALSEIKAFPVGRVEYLSLHPLDFEEFLRAGEYENALEAIDNIPVPEYAHQTLLELFHEYASIGGMPEIIKTWLANRNVADLPTVYDSLWQSFKDDVTKYAKSATERKVIRHVMETAPFELDRIKFEGFGKSNYRSREIGESLRSLEKAGIIELVYPTTQWQLPLEPNFRKRPRLQFVDTGLLIHAMGLQASLIGINDLNDVSRGQIVHHLVSQQLIAQHPEPSFKPRFWVREKSNANAEVDLVYSFQDKVIPIEIKSGSTGRLRSLHQFIDRCGHPYAIRIYGGKFSVEKYTTPAGTSYTLMNMPYYLAIRIPEYIEWFVRNY